NVESLGRLQCESQLWCHLLRCRVRLPVLGPRCVLVPVHVPSVAWAVAAWRVCLLRQTLLVQRSVSQHPSGNGLLCHRAHHQLGLTRCEDGPSRARVARSFCRLAPTFDGDRTLQSIYHCITTP